LPYENDRHRDLMAAPEHATPLPILKLAEALRAGHAPFPSEAPLRVFLACGFTPLHLQTFLTAYLRRACPDRRLLIETGLYGDLAGNLERLRQAGPEAGVVVLEWPDLDPRLGLRHLGGWRPADLPDIVAGARARLALLRERLEGAARQLRLAVCLPTLPLPPVSYLPPRQAGLFECQLREGLASLAVSLAGAGAHLLHAQHLDRHSPPAERLDVKAELLSGFPYRTAHASTLALLLSELVQPPAPRKGLITDLDDTLWRGLVGEVGPDGVSWDLEHGSGVHGLYQQLLASLAEAGVLLGVASKNDPAVVARALEREDLLVSQRHLFPLEVGWGPKSEAVRRILRTWNVAADSIVYIDDSPMELAEVQAAHPEIECLLFPRRDEQAAFALLERLRERFGRERLAEEDALRLESIRARPNPPAERLSDESFLAQAEAELTFDFRKDVQDARPLELLNKTNQFNLNGRRCTEGDWRAVLADAEAVVCVVSYRDRYGPLGKIGVLVGRLAGRTLAVESWVLSCRAFSRRIEQQTLARLFARFDLEAIAFAFEATPRNGPLQTFLTELLAGPPVPGCRLGRGEFLARCPRLFHRVEEIGDE
jgi:FkbH-like protein